MTDEEREDSRKTDPRRVVGEGEHGKILKGKQGEADLKRDARISFWSCARATARDGLRLYRGRPNRPGTLFIIQGSEIRHSHCSASHNSANNTVVEHTRVEWTLSGHFATSLNLISYTYIASRYFTLT